MPAFKELSKASQACKNSKKISNSANRECHTGNNEFRIEIKMAITQFTVHLSALSCLMQSSEFYTNS
ncbi:hypothetical protein T4D_426 [Trichinella pseudospiralis]|nr:hypothetical protein T4D_426 [Trichinella pseudospiralis]